MTPAQQQASAEVPDNPPAFPDCEQLSTGMTLRDWFAGQALPEVMRQMHAQHEGWSWPEAAEDAYAMANAMLAARSTLTGSR